MNSVLTYMLTGLLKKCPSLVEEIKTKHINPVRLSLESKNLLKDSCVNFSGL